MSETEKKQATMFLLDGVSAKGARLSKETYSLSDIVKDDSLAGLQKLVEPLGNNGYSEKDITGIFGGNWIEFLQQSMPESE